MKLTSTTREEGLSGGPVEAESSGIQFGPAAPLKLRLVNGRRLSDGFTLVEMLVVIGLIGIIAALAVPAFKSFNSADKISAATSQLRDDINAARLQAISSRSSVYMLFIPPRISQFTNFITAADLNRGANRTFESVFAGQQTTYAIFSRRSIGDQPGKEIPRYISKWKTLPKGVFIANNKFAELSGGTHNIDRFDRQKNPTIYETNRPFATNSFEFPVYFFRPNSVDPARFNLPYIEFNNQGQLVSERDKFGVLHDAVIALSAGSIIYKKDGLGKVVRLAPVVTENPAGNTTDNYHHVRVNWLTGRPRVERKELKP